MQGKVGHSSSGVKEKHNLGLEYITKAYYNTAPGKESCAKVLVVSGAVTSNYEIKESQVDKFDAPDHDDGAKVDMSLSREEDAKYLQVLDNCKHQGEAHQAKQVSQTKLASHHQIEVTAKLASASPVDAAVHHIVNHTSCH